MKKFSISVIVVFFLTLSCNKYDKNGKLIKDFDHLEKAKWMIGEWQKNDSTGTLKEIWDQLDDSTLVGLSYYILNKKDTIHNEQVELMQTGEHLIYTATIKGQNNNLPIPFQRTVDEDSLLVFENPKHDFPNKIEYKLLKNKIMVATIYGTLNNKKVKESYRMNKID